MHNKWRKNFLNFTQVVQNASLHILSGYKQVFGLSEFNFIAADCAGEYANFG